MSKNDLTRFIVPAELNNADEKNKNGNGSFKTTDLVFLDSKNELKNFGDLQMVASATDYAIVNSVFQNAKGVSITGKKGTSGYFLRSANSQNSTDAVTAEGTTILNGKDNTLFETSSAVQNTHLGIRPSVHLDAKKIAYAQRRLPGFVKISNVKNKSGKVVYHTIEFGEYPKTKASNSALLEKLYEEHKIIATGKKYLGRSKNDNTDFVENLEYEYRGKKYVRVPVFSNNENNIYSDGSKVSNFGCVWIKVEPITWIIKNWDELPTSINPNGTKKATYLDVISEEVIMSGIPFYPDNSSENISLWQNSTIRGFLNGICVSNIKNNGNALYGATNGGNFSKHSFLQEVFRPEEERYLFDDTYEDEMVM